MAAPTTGAAALLLTLQQLRIAVDAAVARLNAAPKVNPSVSVNNDVLDLPLPDGSEGPPVKPRKR